MFSTDLRVYYQRERITLKSSCKNRWSLSLLSCVLQTKCRIIGKAQSLLTHCYMYTFWLNWKGSMYIVKCFIHFSLHCHYCYLSPHILFSQIGAKIAKPDRKPVYIYIKWNSESPEMRSLEGLLKQTNKKNKKKKHH